VLEQLGATVLEDRLLELPGVLGMMQTCAVPKLIVRFSPGLSHDR
jgi:hypothetical protein